MKKLQGMGSMVALATLVTSCAMPDNPPVSINCPESIRDDINDNVVLTGEGVCRIGAGVTITGRVQASEGATVTVVGTVDGNIHKTSYGDVIVDGGTVNNIFESGPGDVKVMNSSLVKGVIDESGTGSIYVTDSIVENRITEVEDGSITIQSGFVTGDVGESDAGDIVIDAMSSVDGDVREGGEGTCNIDLDVVTGVVDCYM